LKKLKKAEGIGLVREKPETAIVRKNLVRERRGRQVTFCNVRSWAIHVEFLELPRCSALLADLVFGCC
jgi:hypothetical protein